MTRGIKLSVLIVLLLVGLCCAFIPRRVILQVARSSPCRSSGVSLGSEALSADPGSSPVLATHQIPMGVQLPLPEALHTLFPSEYASMSKARKLIRKDQVFVNGELKSCQDSVKGGDVVEVRELVKRNFKRTDKFGNARVKAMTIVYEDDHLAVVVKPAGMAVHGTGASSLVDRYAEVLQPSAADPEDVLAKPVHVHRLDAPVGGLLIVAKTMSALRKLGQEFTERRVKKRYRALLLGRIEGRDEEGSISEPVEEKESVSRYQVLSVTPSPTHGALTLVDLYPETGRKHQLRIHAASLGTPILGDLRYGPDDASQLRTRGLFLFAMGLEFAHPVDGRLMTLDAEVPEKFQNTINMEKKLAARLAEEGPSEPPPPAAAA